MTYISRPLYWLQQLIDSGQYVKFRIIGQEGDWTVVSGILFAYLGTETAVEVPSYVYTINSGAFYFSNVNDITIQNMNITISDDAIPEGAVIRSFEDSSAKAWAKQNDYKFEPLVIDVQYYVDKETGIMTVSGTGVYNLDFYTYLPWFTYMWTDPIVTTIEFGEGITQIGPFYFTAFNGLTDVKIPEGIISIGDFAFEYCANLVNVEIPDTVTTIGSYAFSNCPSLAEIMIPDSVTSIGDGAIPEGTVIVAKAGSFAANWAQENGYELHLIETYIVTFMVINGSWDDETSEDKTVALTGIVGSDDLKLKAEQIPEVGSKPASGYMEGSWDAAPDTENALDSDKTYTYTYAEGSAVIPGDLNGDKTVDVFDLVQLRNYIMKPKTTVIYANPDTNGDDTVDVFDLVQMRNYIMRPSTVVIH